MTDLPVQDLEVPGPRVRLRVLLGVLRALAGRRGFADVQWSGGGFAYRLVVVRSGAPGPVELDVDPTALDREALADRIRAALN
jgi:hypothetical protein